MDTHRHPHHRVSPRPLGRSPAEIGRLLAHLEQRLDELDRLHREIAEDPQ